MLHSPVQREAFLAARAVIHRGRLRSRAAAAARTLDPDSYIFASGIRNTQSYDWFDGRHIVMVDHGATGNEQGRRDLIGLDEVNVVTDGDSLGWPGIWGCDAQEGLVSPVLAWENPVPPAGGIFYRGDPYTICSAAGRG